MLRIVSLVCNLLKTTMTDLSVALWVYVIISTFFYRDFDYRFLAATIIFSIGPDMDFIPYLVLRKKYNLLSHHFIHFPLFWLSVAAVMYFVSSPYLSVLLVAPSITHILRDSYPTGIKFFYPFSGIYYRLSWDYIRGIPVFVDAYESRKKRLEEVRVFKSGNRTLFDEVSIRSERLEEWKIVFAAGSVMMTIFYALLFSS